MIERPTLPRVPPRPGEPAAHVRICLALLPSGPDAVRRLKLHRDRAAVRLAAASSSVLAGLLTGKRDGLCCSTVAGDVLLSLTRRQKHESTEFSRGRGGYFRNGRSAGRGRSSPGAGWASEGPLPNGPRGVFVPA